MLAPRRNSSREIAVAVGPSVLNAPTPSSTKKEISSYRPSQAEIPKKAGRLQTPLLPKVAPNAVSISQLVRKNSIAARQYSASAAALATRVLVRRDRRRT